MTFSAFIRNFIVVCLISTLIACGGAEERKQKYLGKGKTYFNEENYDKARIEFKNVLQIDPKTPQPYYFLGRIEEQNKDLPKAVANYNKAIELQPNYYLAQVRLARIYTVIGSEEYIAKAQELLKKVYAEDPGNEEAMLVDATINMIQGDQDAAMSKLNNVIEKNRKLPEAYSLLATIYGVQKKPEAIEDVLKEGISNNPDSIGLRMMLIRLISAQDKLSPRIENILKEIIAIEPEEYNYQVMLSNFYLRAGQNEQAEAQLRKAISENSEDPRRYLVLVQFLAKTRNLGEAEAELIKAVRENPEIEELPFALVDFYKDVGWQDKAISTLKKVIEDNRSEPQLLKAQLALADIYLSQNKIAESEKIIDEVLSDSPGNVDAQFTKGKLNVIHNNFEAAINNLRSVLKSEPRNADAALLLAQAHIRNGQNELAKDVLTKALESDPLNVKNHINQANYFANQKDYKKAEEIVDKALTYFKADRDLLNLKYKLLMQKGDNKEAAKLLDFLAEVYPSEEEVYMQRGYFFANQGQYDKAMQEFETALKNARISYKPLEEIIKVYLKTDRKQEALDYLNRRIAAGKDTVFEHQLKGQVYLELSQPAEALQEFNKAMQDTRWEMPFLSAASVLAADKQYVRAIEVLNGALKKVEKILPVQTQLASLYEKNREYNRAIEVYGDILKVNPANQVAANNMASLLVDYSQDDAQAIARALDLTRVIDHIQHPAFQDTVGWVYLKSNRVQDAIQVLKKVVASAPEVAIFQYHLGMAYQKAGDKVNAKTHLEKAVSSDQPFSGKDDAAQLLKTL